jgi:hypothetical protein
VAARFLSWPLEEVFDGYAEDIGDRVQGAHRGAALAGLDLGHQTRRDADLPSQAARAEPYAQPFCPKPAADVQFRAAGHARSSWMAINSAKHSNSLKSDPDRKTAD